MTLSRTLTTLVVRILLAAILPVWMVGCSTNQRFTMPDTAPGDFVLAALHGVLEGHQVDRYGACHAGEEGVELIRHVIPGLQSSGTLSPYPVPTRKLVFSPSGPLVVVIGGETYTLGGGDSLRFDVTTTYSFSNPKDEPVSYYLLMMRSG